METTTFTIEEALASDLQEFVTVHSQAEKLSLGAYGIPAVGTGKD